MNLHKLIFTNNACYKAGRKITPKGIMVHSTGANNPWLKRYVGPDDGLLGKNQYNNHWNQPMDREVCVHAFIGKLADGTVATYQTLPWDHRGWHAGGSANDTHISFEICEDDLTDAGYLDKVYEEAVDLCVYLCGLYGLTEQDIICHCEGHDLGIASNHGDVLHWWPKHGKNMDTFRAAVAVRLGGDTHGTTSTKHPEKLTEGYYRVRKTWADSKTQKGAYKILSNAKRCADGNPGYSVFDDNGVNIYSPGGSASAPSEDVPFLVQVSISDLNIRKGPGTDYAKTGKFTGKGVFTIMEVKSGQGSTAGWGRLKSGAGWISLDYTSKIK